MSIASSGRAILPSHHRAYPWIAVLAGVICMGRVAIAMRTFNHTIDEPYHIGSAVALWESGRLFVGVQHPPLARWVLGAPLMLEGVSRPEARDTPGQRSPAVEFAGFAVGNDILASGQAPYWRMLISARLALLPFAAIALLFVYRSGRYLASPRAGMLATVFFSLDPTLLGHALFVGTDVAGCAGFVAGMYYGLRWLARPTWLRSSVFGVALALAIASKYNCLFLIPSLFLIAVARVAMARRPWHTLGRLPSILSVVHIVLIAFFVLWATFGFDVGAMRFQALFPSGFKPWENLPAALVETPIPMPSLPLGVLYLFSRGGAGYPVYLNGQISAHGFRLYFPAALAVKEPIGFLVALVSTIAMLATMRRRPKLLAAALLIPSALYFLVAMFATYQLGVRHLLPILPLVYVLIAMMLSRGRRVLWLMLLMLVTAIETAAVHPDYVSFFNIAAGGARDGERYLIDSNLDWGQDLWRLSQWLRTAPEARGGRPIALRVFDDHEPPLGQIGLDPALARAPLEPRRGLLVISKNVKHRLDGASVDPATGTLVLGPDYSWLAGYPIIARVGDSIDVYDLDHPLKPEAK